MDAAWTGFEAVVVTRAASPAGVLVAGHLARKGYDLVLVDKGRPALNALARKLCDQTGRAIEVLVADVDNNEDIDEMIRKVLDDRSIAMLVSIDADETLPAGETLVGRTMSEASRFGRVARHVRASVVLF